MGYWLLCTIPAFPAISSVILTVLSGRLTHREAARLGVGSMALSFAVTVWIAVMFLAAPPEGHVYTEHVWSWIDIGGLAGNVSFQLDSLSLIMMLVITGVGFLIHSYSTLYMAGDAQYSRFFACMNMFVAAMLVLVMADNFLLLFMGWEGVGLCSYLLIGYWYDEPANVRAANKAFLVTRGGDVAMMIGLLLLYSQFGTLHIGRILQQAPTVWAVGAPMAVLAAGLLLVGALGKSGQVPLQVWLPDAMAGPTPVSALIHAATMVTAGVYLIARTHVLFELAPPVQHLVGVLGAASIIIAGLAALVQTDIKRVLAYSTISQVGYMFMALGVGAYSAAMFHFFTHAIFKALLFMAAGAVIVALHHEQNIFKMGGLKKPLKTVYVTFLVGAMSLAAVPFITAGFWSKEEILHAAATSPHSDMLFFAVGVIGAFITGLYTFRLVFIVFFGDEHGHIHHAPGKALVRPLVILAVLATVAGFFDFPFGWFSHFMEYTLPEVRHEGEMSFLLQILAGGVGLVGIALAYVIYFPRGSAKPETEPRGIHRFLYGGLGFDTLYTGLIAWPYVEAAHANRKDMLHLPAFAIRQGLYGTGLMLRAAQNGKLRWYLAVMAGGAAMAIYLVAYR